MDVTALKELASGLAPLAGIQHLVLFAILVIVWTRRDAASRVLTVYFAVAFGTAAAAMLTSGATRLRGVASLAICALWIYEAAKPRIELAFARTPRARLVLMAASGAFAVCYPGYSGNLPAFIFSPIGVLAAPTLLAALSLLNASSGETSRALHWTLATTGVVVAAVGLTSREWVQLPLLLCSLYSIPILLGRSGLRPESETKDPASVSEIRRRMYSRRSILPGPRDPRRGSRTVRIRRR